MARRPPFTNLREFAQVLEEKVPDRMGNLVAEDYVEEALRAYSEANPLVETTDIGDDSTKAWAMDDSPFTGWDEGFSENFPVRIEQLSALAPQSPQEFLVEGPDFWFDLRTASGVTKRWLQFYSTPTLADKVRVKWKRRRLLDNAATAVNEIPRHHQMAVVYLACEAKCLALASIYRSASDQGADTILDADTKADGYERDAARWKKKAGGFLGVGRKSSLRHRQVRSGTERVFRRGYG